MIFRQLFEPDSSTYSYLISCPDTVKTALIDPVLDTAQRDAGILQDMGLKLDYTIDTIFMPITSQVRVACGRMDSKSGDAAAL